MEIYIFPSSWCCRRFLLLLPLCFPLFLSFMVFACCAFAVFLFVFCLFFVFFGARGSAGGEGGEFVRTFLCSGGYDMSLVFSFCFLVVLLLFFFVFF